MKINEKTRFPYPVLSDLTGDYKSGKFSFDIEISESSSGGGKVSLSYKRNVAEEGLQRLLDKKEASVGVFITCLETYYNELVPAEGETGILDFPAGTLNGRVDIRPVMWSKQAISSYQNDNLHPEFQNSIHSLSKGSVLALGDECAVVIGREKLAPMETIFSLVENEKVPEGEFKVQTEGHKISINAAPGTYTKINLLRNTKDGKIMLLNSVYLPCIIEILSVLRENPEEYQDKGWFRVFKAKYESLGIDIDTGSLLEHAQKLLRSPFGRIKIGDVE